MILSLLVMVASSRMSLVDILNKPPGMIKNGGSTRFFGMGNENIALTEGKSVTIKNGDYPSKTMFQYRNYEITAPASSTIKITCKNTQLMCG